MPAYKIVAIATAGVVWNVVWFLFAHGLILEKVVWQRRWIFILSFVPWVGGSIIILPILCEALYGIVECIIEYFVVLWKK